MVHVLVETIVPSNTMDKRNLKERGGHAVGAEEKTAHLLPLRTEGPPEEPRHQASRILSHVRPFFKEIVQKASLVHIGIHRHADTGKRVTATEVKIAYSCIELRRLRQRQKVRRIRNLKTIVRNPLHQHQPPQKRRRKPKRKTLLQGGHQEHNSPELERQSRDHAWLRR